MATVFDVAQYILALCRENNQLPITTWKVQKLVYYAQAWSLVWDDEPLFDEDIEAWANGPVCPELYKCHRGQFQISSLEEGNLKALTKRQKSTVQVVFEHYSKKTAQYLSELTHRERPWIEARKGLKPGQRGQRPIRLDVIAEYYGGL